MMGERTPRTLLSEKHEKYGEEACLKCPQVSTKTRKGQVSESGLTENQTDGEGYRALILANGYSVW